MNRAWMLLSLFLAAPAWAGITLETSTPKLRSTVQIQGERLRLDQSNAEGVRSMLVDNGSKTLTVLNTRAKTYRQIDAQRIAVASAAERQRVEEALAKMPAVQRERVAEALRRSGQGGSGLASSTEESPSQQIRFEAMGRKDQVAGYACEWYRGYQGGRVFGESCYIPYEATGASRDELKSAQKTLELLRVIWARMGRDETPDPGWDKAPGFPGIRVPFSPTGQRKDEERLVSIKQGAIGPEVLAIPSDYVPDGQKPAPKPPPVP
jgi:hypothetical protein